MKKINFDKLSVVIVVHQAIPVGPSYDLKNFFIKHKINELLFITHPLIYLKEFYKDSSSYFLYKNGDKVASKIAFHWVMPDLFLYIKDFLYSITWVCLQRKKFSIFIGADPLNAFAGLFLKKIGKVEKVVYYAIDYFPKRFKNPILNWIYHLIDKLSVRYSDETWNLSETMITARKMGKKKQFVVPVGVWFGEVKRKAFVNIKKNKLIFIGSLLPIMGVDELLYALSIIVKKYQKTELHIIGGGQEKLSLEKLTKKLSLTEHVFFYGWITNTEKLYTLMSDGALGLAPFNPALSGEDVKNADPAKLKDYMVYGMPVLVTDAISSITSANLKNAKCGDIVIYDRQKIADGILTFFMNPLKLAKYRKAAVKYIKQFDYEQIYSSNIVRLLD